MLKLRILLLRNVCYYIILAIAIIYFLITFFFIKYSSNYNNITFLEAKITDITIKDYGIQLTIKDKKYNESIIAYYYIDTKEINKFINNYQLGDYVSIKCTEKELNNNTIPNTFNYKKYLYNQKIFKIIEIKEINLIQKNKNLIFSLKNILLKRTVKLEKSYSYINGLIFGKNTYINDDVLESYRDIGISHLFAISGTHISVFTLVFEKILKKLRVKENKRYIVLIIFLLFYMFLTNYSMSVMRASIFTILLLINKIFYFYIKPQNLLYLTLSIIIFLNPLYLFNIGLQFSFLISLSLILLKDYINKRKKKISKLFIISFISFIVSFPILINNFYQVNFLSIIYNIFFVPYVSLILLPITIISYILPFIDKILFFLINIMENICLILSKINFLKFIFCKVSLSIFVLYYVVIGLSFYMLKRGKKRYLLILLLIILLNYLKVYNNKNYVMFFDVGQGDSSLLIVNKTVNLIDTGGSMFTYDSKYTYQIAKNKIIPYLKSQGIKEIDNLILTHGDADHMRESIYIVDNFKVNKVIFNIGEINELENQLIELLNEKKIKYYKNLKELNIGNDKLYFLQTKEYNNENDNSNVVYFSYYNYKFLFMGDAGVNKEKDIVDEYNLKDIDILKIGHHGSKSSSSKEFINDINPKYSIISVGKNNRYGHPNKEVLENLKDSKIYRTDEDGSVMFKIRNNKLKIETCSP